jgi:hypothetical protein
VSADELQARGDAAANPGTLKEALAAYRAAWDAKPGNARIACNIGRIELVTGNYPAAAEWLTRCVRLMKEQIKPDTLDPRRAEVQDLELARAHVGALLIEATPGASITLDNGPERVGTAPLSDPIFVTPGEHRVDVRLGKHLVTRTIDARAGQEHRIEVRLPAEEPPLAARPDPSRNPARVEPERRAPAPGASRAFVWWPVAVGGALAVTAASLGVVFQVVSHQAGEGAEETLARVEREQSPPGLGCGKIEYHREGCNEFARLETRHVAFGDAAIGAFIASGVFGAAALGYAVYENNRVKITPSLGGIVGRYTW